jgi:hypothetical protein
MVSYKNYVAGWLNSSIHDFLQALPPNVSTTRYALITCLDSNVAPSSMLGGSHELASLAIGAQQLGKGLLLPTRLLQEADSGMRLLFGFDEVWFFPSAKIEPKPDSAWLVGPARMDQAKLGKLASWMSRNACALALGDGDGLNFIVKAEGLGRHLLGHSLDQPQPASVAPISLSLDPSSS